MVKSPQIEYEDKIMRARISGDIDHHCAKFIRKEIDSFIFEHKPLMIIIDLSGVEFMDSSGLGLILGRYTNACEIGAKFAIYCPNRKIRKILELAGIERIMRIEGDDGYEIC